jgi:hypothetical protein
MLRKSDLLRENRAFGWNAVPFSAPRWVKDQLIAARTAQLRGIEFRVTPQMLKAEAEYRSLNKKPETRHQHIERAAAPPDRKRVEHLQKQLAVLGIF